MNPDLSTKSLKMLTGEDINTVCQVMSDSIRAALE